MSATLQEAYDEIMTTFKTAWDTTGLTALYPNRPGEAPTGDDANENPNGYAKVFIDIVDQFQATLTDANMTKRWRSLGIFTAQLFSPSGLGAGWITNAMLVANAFRGVTTASGVIFRRPVPQPVGIEGIFFQANVVVSFEFDEIA